MHKNVLLVEGKSDQELFKYLLKANPELSHIDLSPPKPLGFTSDGIDGLLDALPNLLKFKEFGGNLAVVLDADYNSTNKGFTKRRSQIIEILEPFGYEVSNSLPEIGYGELFAHPDLTPFGLWIMPDHGSEGMVETLLSKAITDTTRLELFNYISTTANQLLSEEHLKEICFKASHKDKTLFNTWLFWQKQPPECKSDSTSIIECALSQGWLDYNNTTIQNLLAWLLKVFENDK